MKLNKYLLLFVLFLVSYNANAQYEEKLRLQSTFFSNKFFKGDTLISVNQVLYEMSPNETAYNLMKSAKRDFVFGQIVGATAGVLIGWPIGTAVAGGEPNWTLAAVGVGVLAISIPISLNFRKKAHAAITEHNRLITGSANFKYKPNYSFVFSGNMLKVNMTF